MKKYIITISSVLLISVITNAQTLYVPNGTAGIGTSGNTNVGIGTTSTPSQKLHVVGRTQFDANITGDGGGRFHFNRPTGNYECFLSINTNGTYKWLLGMDNYPTSGPADDLILFNSTATKMMTMKQDGTILFSNSGIDRVTIKTDGMVGIGVVPEATLHVGGNVKLGDPNYNGRNWIINSQNWMDGGDFFINPDKTTDGTDDYTKGIRISRTTGNFIVGHGVDNVANATLGNAYGSAMNYGTAYLGFNAQRNPSTGSWTFNDDNANSGGGVIWGTVAGNISFSPIPNLGASGPYYQNDAYVAGKKAMDIRWNTTTNTPQVTIGSQTITSGAHTDFRLSVDGKLVAKEIYVTNTGWADYVFDDDYQLMSLDSLNDYIKINNHLPNVPTTEEVLINGNNAGETDRILLEKIEELTLYIIEQQNQIQELKDKLKNN